MKLLVVLLAIAGAAYYFFWPLSEDSETLKRGAPLVEVANPTSKTLHDEVAALGTARAFESVVVTANLSEYLDEALVADGAQVKQGDVLIRLQQNEEQAQLKAAKVQAAEHWRELKRLQGLLKNKAASQRDVDERRTQARRAQQEIAEIEARIQDRTLTARFDGVVGVRRLSPGALVQPGEVITTLDKIDRIKLDFTIPATQLNNVHKDTTITASSSVIKDTVFKGVVDTVETRIDEASRSVRVRALIDNAQGVIHPGMLMQVSIMAAPRQALMLPEEAVLQKGKTHYVFVVGNDNMVEQRDIKTGTRLPGWVEVVTGVSADENIITRGVVKARPGQAVTIASDVDPKEGA